MKSKIRIAVTILLMTGSLIFGYKTYKNIKAGNEMREGTRLYEMATYYTEVAYSVGYRDPQWRDSVLIIAQGYRDRANIIYKKYHP